MPELNSGAKGGKKGGKKSEEQAMEQKVPSGTAAPLPTEADVPTEEAKAADEKAQKLAAAKTAAAEAIKAKLEALKKELAATKEAEKAERDKEKNAKKAEREASLAARAEKEKQLAEADAKIAKAQKDLEATEEWKVLKAMEAERAAIGPLPKVRAPREDGAPRGPRKKAVNGMTPNMIRVLEVMVDGGERTSSQLAEATGILKGKRLPEMVELGYLSELVAEEGSGRGKRFVITDAGKDALAKAKTEAAAAPAKTAKTE